MQQLFRSTNKFKYCFIGTAILIALASILVTDRLVKNLAQEERKKIEVWAQAVRLITMQAPESGSEMVTNTFNEYNKFTLKLIEQNTTIPLILADENNQLIHFMNIDSAHVRDEASIKKQIARFKGQNTPIIIHLDENIAQYVYYDESTVLKNLQVFPYIQLSVVAIFIIISFLALNSSKKAEQNKVWVGLSKETAHQLGTPISSLMAWIEYLQTKDIDPKLLDEIDKDVQRLKMIAERFSKIGSNPESHPMALNETIQNAIAYMERRISSKVQIVYNCPNEPILALMNESLFGWVIENLIKNAVDAMNGQGQITFTVEHTERKVKIDISDTGKGIPKSKFETIFNPGYTTKNRGWGLGLSLVKRIIESYQKGKIYVLRSELNKGTTFRIELTIYGV